MTKEFQDSSHCQKCSLHTSFASIMNNSSYEASVNNVWVTGIDYYMMMRTPMEDLSGRDSITNSASWQNVNQPQSHPGQMPSEFQDQAPEVNMADVQINGPDLMIEMDQAHICGQELIEAVLTIL